ncbi:MAG: hypothetical protein KDA57_05210 [Planctomycetales bacterium]|nr:hypothetical protein [Planctomycetales bacterium]
MNANKEVLGFSAAFVVAALVGIASCVDGIRSLVSGSQNVTWLTDHNVLVRSFNVTGASARLLGTAELTFGVSLVVAAGLLPRAIDARRTRGSLLALPTWARGLLVAATLMLGVSTIVIVSTFFWPASS